MKAHRNILFPRTNIRLAAIAVLAPALGLGVPALSSATAQASSCPFTYFCTWQNSGYTGTQWNYYISSHIPVATWMYVGKSANDQISSYNNNNTDYAYIAKNCPADSVWTWIEYAGTNSNLASSWWQDGTTINDSISAIAIGAEGAGIKYPIHGSRTMGGC